MIGIGENGNIAYRSPTEKHDGDVATNVSWQSKFGQA